MSTACHCYQSVLFRSAFFFDWDFLASSRRLLALAILHRVQVSSASWVKRERHQCRASKRMWGGGAEQ